MNLNRRLIIRCGREYLWFLGRDGGVRLNQFGKHASHSFDTQRKWGYVQQEHVFYIPCQYTTLNSGTNGHNLIWVYSFWWFFTEEFLNGFLYRWDTGRTTYQDNFINITFGKSCRFQRFLTGLDGPFYQIGNQLLKFGTGQCSYQVLWSWRRSCNVRQVDFCLCRRGQLDFGLFGSFPQTLQCHGVFTKVHILIFLELFGQPINNFLVNIVTTQVGITIRGQYFEHSVTQFQNGNVMRTSTKVEYYNFLFCVLFIKSVCQRSGGWLVDDSFHGKTCNFTSFLGGLSLWIVKICWNGNYRSGYILSQVILRGLLHFLKNHGRQFLWSVQTSVNIHSWCIIVPLYHFVRNPCGLFTGFWVFVTHKSLNGINRFVRVGHRLSFCRVSDLDLPTVNKCDHRWSGTFSLGVWNYHGFVTFHYRDAGVGRT